MTSNSRPSSCISCPGAVSRSSRGQKLLAIESYMERYTAENEPTFDISAPDLLKDSLQDKFGVPSKDIDPLFLCARQRYLGMCSLSLDVAPGSEKIQN